MCNLYAVLRWHGSLPALWGRHVLLLGEDDIHQGSRDIALLHAMPHLATGGHHRHLSGHGRGIVVGGARRCESERLVGRP
jgi:hypothetical protein